MTIRHRRWPVVLLASSLSLPLAADEHPVEPRQTYGAWGGPGLMQTPTARLGEAGEASFTLSYTEPYARLSVMLQPFDWLEAGFRYIDIRNRDFGVSTTGQSLKDKSIDARVRLLTESAWRPALAVGLRDLGGTGLFSGEYVVAGKRWGDLDFSLGLGWGYLGSRGDIDSPLGWLDERFDAARAASRGSQGGEFNVGKYFRGPAAVFGGVSWFVPDTDLVLKLELDGNDYQAEPFDNNQTQNAPVNVGLGWKAFPGLELHAGFERGDTATVGFTLHANLRQLRSQPKLLDPAPEPLQPSPTVPEREADLVAALQANTGLDVRRIRRDGQTLRVEAEQNVEHLPARVLDRMARVLHNRTDDEVRWFTLGVEQRGLEMIDYDLPRAAFVAQASMPDPDPQGQGVVMASAPARVATPASYTAPLRRVDGGLGLNYGQVIGGPDAFILYQLSVELAGELRLSRNAWVDGALNYRLLDNYDNFTFTAQSQLPRVRTFQREYLTSSDLTLPSLQFNLTRGFGDDLFALVYGGLLESMFAGVGGELLYRPVASRFAVGVDVNRVRQRAFEQDFGLRDYEVTTGHVTLYAKTGFEGVLAQLQVGRYLAGDVGATIDLSREFRNGVRIGAYATFTDVSDEAFGEGSFDKGLYVLLPMDLLLPTRTRSVANLTYSPLTRDGGARLNRRHRLYDLTRDRDTDALFGNLEALQR